MLALHTQVPIRGPGGGHTNGEYEHSASIQVAPIARCMRPQLSVSGGTGLGHNGSTDGYLPNNASQAGSGMLGGNMTLPGSVPAGVDVETTGVDVDADCACPSNSTDTSVVRLKVTLKSGSNWNT